MYFSPNQYPIQGQISNPQQQYNLPQYPNQIPIAQNQQIRPQPTSPGGRMNYVPVNQPQPVPLHQQFNPLGNMLYTFQGASNQPQKDLVQSNFNQSN
jgi:hypothetical protein